MTPEELDKGLESIKFDSPYLWIRFEIGYEHLSVDGDLTLEEMRQIVALWSQLKLPSP